MMRLIEDARRLQDTLLPFFLCAMLLIHGVMASAGDLAPSELAGASSIQGQNTIMNIHQQGSGNQVSATQNLEGNTIHVQQDGNLNSARLAQQGGNQVSLMQSGMGQRAEIQQIQGGPAIGIRQTGGASFVRASQF